MKWIILFAALLCLGLFSSCRDKILETTPVANLSGLKLTFPESGSYISGDPLLCWSLMESNHKFIVLIAEDSLFTKNLKSYTIYDTLITIVNLSKNITYYWKVKIADITDTMIETKFSTFIRDDHFEQLSPAMGSTNQPSSINFVWNINSPKGVSYSVTYSERSDFQNANRLITPVKSDNLTGIMSISVYDQLLSKNTLYYWRVEAIDAADKKHYSKTWNFNTGAGNFIPTNNISISLKGLHYWKYSYNNQPGFQVKDTLLNLIDIIYEYPFFTNINQKYHAEYSYNGLMLKDIYSMDVYLNAAYTMIDSLVFNYNYNNLSLLHKITLTLKNIPLESLSNSNLFKISGVDCAKSFVQYSETSSSTSATPEPDKEYVSTKWDKDSYILIEFKK